MSNTITSPNMGLPVPVVSVDPGPDYATNVNTSLNTIDSHNHTSGKGVPIPSSGLNINSDLTFQGNNQTNVRTTRFSVQPIPLTSGSDVGAVYVAGSDLYYNDTAGNQIRMTQGGSIAGTAGSIGGLTAPATVTYSSVSKTFVFQSDVTTPANLDAGSVIFRNVSAGSNGATVSAPSGLGVNYNLTLPLAPAATSFLGIDSSGIITAVGSVSQGITRANLASIGQQVSSTSGNASVFTNVFSSVSALQVHITTTGRPVMVMLQDDGSLSGSNFSFPFGSNDRGSVSIIRNGSRVTSSGIGAQIGSISSGTSTSGVSAIYPPGVVSYLDVIGAGTYIYAIEASASSGSMNILNMKLVAWEL